MKAVQKIIHIKTEYGIFKTVFKSWENERGYCVRVPTLPEIVTGGDSLQEARKMVREAIEFCVEYKNNEHHTDTASKRNHRVAA